MTLPTQLVLRALLSRPADPAYGLSLCEDTGLPTGTVYPILTRLERYGWIASRWEQPEEYVEHGRPRRRDYQLTP
jgi:PadR family transcriptional regulator, regulatory protein PadR